MKPLSTGQEYFIKRLVSFFMRHHYLLRRIVFYNKETDNRTFYYIFEDISLLIVTDCRLSRVKVELFRNTDYLYVNSVPTLIFNGSDSKLRYIYTEK